MKNVINKFKITSCSLLTLLSLNEGYGSFIKEDYQNLNKSNRSFGHKVKDSSDEAKIERKNKSDAVKKKRGYGKDTDEQQETDDTLNSSKRFWSIPRFGDISEYFSKEVSEVREDDSHQQIHKSYEGGYVRSSRILSENVDVLKDKVESDSKKNTISLKFKFKI